MSNKPTAKIIAGAVLVLCVMAVILTVMLVRRQPQYKGKPQSYWLEEYNRAGSMENTAGASDAFNAMGAKTIPYLLRCIQHTQELASAACLAFRALGPEAEPAVPELARLLTADDWRGEMALLCVGKTAQPALEEVCASTNRNARMRSALTLSRVSDGSRRNLSWGWETSAVTGKRKLGLGYVIVSDDISAVVRQLRHSNPAVRQASAEVLCKYSRQAKSARRALLSLLNDTEPQVCEAAREAIGAIDAQPK